MTWGWRPSSVLRDALLRTADDAVVDRFAATLRQPVDLTPLYRFVRHVRADIGPDAEILDAALEDGTCIVWYRRPGEKVEASTPGPGAGLSRTLNRGPGSALAEAVVPGVGGAAGEVVAGGTTSSASAEAGAPMQRRLPPPD